MTRVCGLGGGCAIPDCDFGAQLGSPFCYCHTRGFNPPMSCEEYLTLDANAIRRYRYKIRKLELAVQAVNK